MKNSIKTKGLNIAFARSVSVIALAVAAGSTPTFAQAADDGEVNEIVVTGIRASLQASEALKKASPTIVPEAIRASSSANRASIWPIRWGDIWVMRADDRTFGERCGPVMLTVHD